MRVPGAKRFKKDGNQAVRPQKESQFVTHGEILVRHEGQCVILEAADEWPEAFRACLGACSGETPRPKQKRLKKLRDPFA